MRRAGRTLVLTWIACAPACVQVLGLEDARLDTEAAKSEVPQVVVGTRSALWCAEHPDQACPCMQAPVLDCSTCLSECPGAAQCASDSRCRAELDAYGACLGARCGATDEQQEACVGEISADFARLKECVTSCAGRCRKTRLASACELYCGCMAEFCRAPDAAIEIEPAGDCMTSCLMLEDDERVCRRNHCEYGRGDLAHCRHASDQIHVCVTADERPANDRSFCLDRSESTWPCGHDDECCSRACSNGACD